MKNFLSIFYLEIFIKHSRFTVKHIMSFSFRDNPISTFSDRERNKKIYDANNVIAETV